MFNYFHKLNIYECKAGKGTRNWLAKLSDDMSDMYYIEYSESFLTDTLAIGPLYLLRPPLDHKTPFQLSFKLCIFTFPKADNSR